jgi:hypothetical protein
MFFNIFKKKEKKSDWPEKAIYKPRDFVRFRHRGELHFGFVNEARVEDGEVLYTLQMGGECPTFVYNYKEDQIVGKVN